MDSPSFWVVRGAALLPSNARVLDLACGELRHARFLAGCGFAVVAVDRNPRPVADAFGLKPEKIDYRQTDLENGSWPLRDEKFDGIVVTNYLHRPLFGHLLDALQPGGVLIYETFAQGNAALGRPARPEFLLNPGELLDVFASRMTVVAYEHGEVSTPKPAVVQRLLARRPV